MVLKVLGATLAEIAKGLLAAQAVLDQAGVTDIQGARAEFDLEGWDVAYDMDEKRRPGADVFDAAAALDRARGAAVAACCAEWAALPDVQDWSLDVISSHL
ncbi:hypothetical protein QTI51_24540 [Variovorax sp. J22G73]|uniref:hypothetical protein n=1 Tax=unclassified Variovorax TaxID=663243 RepID=UPI0025790CF0|nr:MULTISPECIES: hypothetical protein [unclassified Variovorax]MDM0100469.1 hypothetical protein [Variovorax sp. J22G73]